MSTVTLDWSQLLLLIVNVVTVVGAFYTLRGDIHGIKKDVESVKSDVNGVKDDIRDVKKKAEERGGHLDAVRRDVAVLASHVQITPARKQDE